MLKIQCAWDFVPILVFFPVYFMYQIQIALVNRNPALNHHPKLTASAGQRRGDVEICNYLRDQAGSRSLVFELSITHHRFGSSSHVHQNGLLSHPQDLDAPLRLAAQRKINSYRQQYA